MAEPPSKRAKRTDSSIMWDRNERPPRDAPPRDRKDKRDDRDRDRTNGHDDRRHRSRSRDKRRERSRSRERERDGGRDRRDKDRHGDRGGREVRDRKGRDRTRSRSRSRSRDRRPARKGEVHSESMHSLCRMQPLFKEQGANSEQMTSLRHLGLPDNGHALDPQPEMPQSHLSARALHPENRAPRHPAPQRPSRANLHQSPTKWMLVHRNPQPQTAPPLLPPYPHPNPNLPKKTQIRKSPKCAP